LCESRGIKKVWGGKGVKKVFLTWDNLWGAGGHVGGVFTALKEMGVKKKRKKPLWGIKDIPLTVMKGEVLRREIDIAQPTTYVSREGLIQDKRTSSNPSAIGPVKGEKEEAGSRRQNRTGS